MQGTIKCQTCGRDFMAKDSRTKYCSGECRRAAYKEKRKMKPRQLVKQICPQCGKEFETVGSRKIYCSCRCSKKSYYERIKSPKDVCQKSCLPRERTPRKETERCRKQTNRQETAAINEEARARHMTYGQYQAMLYAQSISGR